MDTLFIGQNKITLDSVDSTNNFAANLLKTTNVLDGTVIMSDFQTKGRGQQGNSWHSLPKMNLMCSIILKPTFIAPDKQFYLSKIVSLGIIGLLNEIGIDATIKWPNDVMVRDAKIAGVLIENALKKTMITSSIFGIGLNVNQTEFEHLKATSIRKEGVNMTTEQVLSVLCKHIEAWYLTLKRGNLHLIDEAYFANLYLLNKDHVFTLPSGEKLVGKITDVKKNGLLEIKKDGLSHLYDFKEISF